MDCCACEPLSKSNATGRLLNISVGDEPQRTKTQYKDTVGHEFDRCSTHFPFYSREQQVIVSSALLIDEALMMPRV